MGHNIRLPQTAPQKQDKTPLTNRRGRKRKKRLEFLSTIPAEHAVGDVEPARQYEPATKQGVSLCLPQWKLRVKLASHRNQKNKYINQAKQDRTQAYQQDNPIL
jgi:hypothetical protein